MSALDGVAASPTLPSAPAVVREAPGGETLRAIVIEKFGGLDSLVYTEIPKPRPKDGEVVIAVKGFGINHAEIHMRRGGWAEAAEVSGIECVGVVDSCPGGEFPVGAKVAGLMGGLGRTINGSYAQFNPLAQMASGVHFSLFASPEFGNPRFPLSDVPLSDIAAQVQAGQLDAAPVRVFTFDEIKAAQNLAETGEAGGKMVVVLD